MLALRVMVAPGMGFGMRERSGGGSFEVSFAGCVSRSPLVVGSSLWLFFSFSFLSFFLSRGNEVGYQCSALLSDEVYARDSRRFREVRAARSSFWSGQFAELITF